ncbi:ribonuclease P protein subunit p30 [Teleopsis dalmanni]|uniref:ribonuclease P protein subunit p30 n=1 Tax=Teleopsis dalmanni TaxID=139649 RepID=UPI0018CDAE7E|nr:ribonuclease P protein subunit p30 [Teleopsis dalmanni]
MEDSEPFYDFCVPYNKDETAFRETLKELFELGYKTIAIEEIFTHGKKVGVKLPRDMFPKPVNIEHLRDEYKTKMKILQRITIIYSESSVAHAMSISSNIKMYDIIAGQPKTDAALTHCCANFTGELITFDIENGAKLLVNHKSYSIACNRGKFFELKYAPAIRDSNVRKDLIKIAHNYRLRDKPKNVIISSGANNAFEVRSPYDIANLSLIFGFSEDQGKCAINRYGRQLFLKACARRIGKTFMYIKGSGPVVFSIYGEDDAISDEEDMEAEEGADSDESDMEAEEGSIADTEEKTNDELLEQPSKKLKTA